MSNKVLPESPPLPRSGRTILKIDPRFARRWTQVRREQGRRRLRMILVATAVVIVVGLAAGSLYSPLFDVRHVRLSVIGSVPRAEVLSVTGLTHPRPLFEVDSGALAARLDAVADLGGAVVRRSWPTTVRIEVVHRVPIALVARPSSGGDPPGWATVDATGRVLADVRSPVIGLPVLRGVGPVPPPGGWLPGSAGPDASAATAALGRSVVDLNAAADSPSVPAGPAAALAVLAALPPSVRGDVQTVTVVGAGLVTMSVLPATIAAGSIAVDVGDGSQLAKKLTALAALLTQANLGGVTAIDLTVPDRPAALTTRQTPGTVSTHAGG